MPAVKAASLSAAGSPAFEGSTFHLLRHTASSLMALSGMDAAAAAERLGHTDGRARFLRRYRHLYEDTEFLSQFEAWHWHLYLVG